MNIEQYARTLYWDTAGVLWRSIICGVLATTRTVNAYIIVERRLTELLVTGTKYVHMISLLMPTSITRGASLSIERKQQWRRYHPYAVTVLQGRFLRDGRVHPASPDPRESREAGDADKNIAELLREKRRRFVLSNVNCVRPYQDSRRISFRSSQTFVGGNFSFLNTTERRYAQTFDTE